jgi:tRNA(fMet)-specific endonuclease VapC
MLRGNRAVIDRVRAQTGGVFVCFMTVAELAYGAEKSAKPEFNRTLVERFLLTLAVIESARSSMRIFGRLKANLALAGEILPDADLLIASVALDRDLTLATGNIKHFERIPRLRAEDWLHP